MATVVFLPPGFAITTASQAQPPGTWLAPFWNMDAEPGGTSRCLYVHCCWPCASGDIASRIGRSYFFECVNACHDSCMLLCRKTITVLLLMPPAACAEAYWGCTIVFTVRLDLRMRPLLFVNGVTHSESDSSDQPRLAGVPWGLTRSQIRRRDGIPGTFLGDCIAVTCCPCCYLAQALNHLDLVDAAAAAGAAPTAGGPAGTALGNQALPGAATGASKA